MGRVGGHHPDALTLVELPVDDTYVRHDTAVRVVHRVEDHGARGSVLDTDRGGHLGDDLVEQRLDTQPGLGGDLENVRRVAANEIGKLLGELLGLGGRQVDLVEHRNDLQIVLHRQIQIGEGLGLDALSGVDEKNGPLTGREGPGDLVGEVDVPRGVDHVEDVRVARVVRGRPGQPYGLGLDRDATLALDVHPVEVLSTHLPLVDDTGQLEHPVGERGLAVVDVRDDAEIADLSRGGTARRGDVARDRGHAGS